MSCPSRQTRSAGSIALPLLLVLVLAVVIALATGLVLVPLSASCLSVLFRRGESVMEDKVTGGVKLSR